MPPEFLQPIPILLAIVFVGSIAFLVGYFIKVTSDCDKLLNECRDILDDWKKDLNGEK